MHSFDTDVEAKNFVREQIDTPAAERYEYIGSGIELHVYSQELDEGTFTNVYDLSFDKDNVMPSVTLHDQLTSVYDYVRDNSDIKTATGGGFFFLADQASGQPRHMGLNAALSEGMLHSFPSVDRESVVIDNGRLSTQYIQACGELTLNNAEVSWSGSLTDHETDAKVFGNGNSVITHMHNDVTGSIRVLDENSRFTPEITDEEMIDIGFIRREDGVFIGITSSSEGKLDIFSHDVVVRTHERYAHGELPMMTVKTLGGKAIDGALEGVFSAGPMLGETDFTNHPINSDKSLGGRPPFLDVPLARSVLYEADGKVHIRLYDGRPGSQVFPGLTPRQVADDVLAGANVEWGGFLDPGQTTKLVVRSDDGLESHGNRHYMKWPSQPGEKFIWVPNTGRPTASMITLR